MPVSSEIAGSRMLTAEVLALTMSVEIQVTARTAPARVPAWVTSVMSTSFRWTGRFAVPTHPVLVGGVGWWSWPRVGDGHTDPRGRGSSSVSHPPTAHSGTLHARQGCGDD